MLLEKVKPHIVLEPNKEGRDFFVGDIHGNKKELIEHLVLMEFDFLRDRLICAGDIIDRGQESEACIEMLMEPWFYSTLGNHEAMFLLGFNNADYWGLLVHNGGDWLEKLKHDPKKLYALGQLIRIKMPVAFSVKSPGGTIGVIHANAPSNWLTLHSFSVNETSIYPFLWQRVSLDNNEMQAIENVDAVVHGHTTLSDYRQVNNQFWIDTKRKSGAFTVIEDKELLDRVNKDRVNKDRVNKKN